MKKKYLYSLMAFVMAICGFTAWSAVAGVNPGTPTELTLQLDKFVPAENGSVKGLTYILFTFGEEDYDIQINPGYTKAKLGSISIPNPTGTGYKVIENITNKSQFDHEIDGKPVAHNQIVYHLENPITVEEAAQYHLAFANDALISAGGAVNPAIKYDWTILPDNADPEPLILNPTACVPAEGELVADLTHIVLTFGENDTDIKLNPDYVGSNIGLIRQTSNLSTVTSFPTASADSYLTHEIDGQALADNQIGIILEKTLTETTSKECELLIHKGVFMSGTTGGILEESASYKFVLRKPLGDLKPIESSIPANGSTVEAPVTEIIFNTSFKTCEKNNAFFGPSKVKIVNAETGEVVEDSTGKLTYKVNGATLDDNQYAYILTTPLEAGKYTVYLAARVLYNTKDPKDENEAYECTFTVTGTVPAEPITLNPAACVPAPDSDVISVSHIILTFGEGETDIKLNPDYTFTNVGYIRDPFSHTTLTFFRTAEAESYLTHEVDGKALADNQIAFTLPTPLTVTIEKEYEFTVIKDALISGTTGGALGEDMRYKFTVIPPQRPIIATEPADGSTVEAPVTDILLTFDPDMYGVDANLNHKIVCGYIYDAVTGNLVEDFSAGEITFALNGVDLDMNQLAYVLATPLEAGSYKVTIPERAFLGDTYENEAYEFSFTVKGEENPDVETFDFGFSYSSYGITNNYDYTFRRVKFNTNVTFLDIPKGFTVNPELTPVQWIRESDGTVVTADVRDFMDTPMMFTESADWPSEPSGIWTCVLPQGLFKVNDTESMEKTLKVTWINPNAEPPRPDFAVTKFDFFNTPDSFESEEGQPDGVPAPMMFTLWKTVEGGEDMMNWETDPKVIDCLNSNRGFVINTNWDEWIQCFIAEVKRKDGTGETEVWNQETVQEIYGYGNYCKNYVGESVLDCTSYQHPMLGCGGNEDTREFAIGVEYTLDIWFYDSMAKRGMDTKAHKNACGSYHLEFTGGTAPFEYSSIAKLISVSPVPVNSAALGLDTDEAAGVVKGLEAPIEFTWSAPVTMTAKYSLGSSGGLADTKQCTPNEDRTVWTVVPGEGCISNGEGDYLTEFEFDVQAIDDEGHYVKGNVGEKRNTMFVPEFKFELEPVGVETVETRPYELWSESGAVIVSGLEEGMTATLYTLDGLKLAKATASDNSVTFTNVVPGIYVVIVSDGNTTATYKMIHK